jgi:hypothetical protein
MYAIVTCLLFRINSNNHYTNSINSFKNLSATISNDSTNVKNGNHFYGDNRQDS